METKEELLNIMQAEVDKQKEIMLKLKFLNNQIKDFENKINNSNKKINEINSILKQNYSLFVNEPIEKEFYEFIK